MTVISSLLNPTVRFSFYQILGLVIGHARHAATRILLGETNVNGVKSQSLVVAAATKAAVVVGAAVGETPTEEAMIAEVVVVEAVVVAAAGIGTGTMVVIRMVMADMVAAVAR